MIYRTTHTTLFDHFPYCISFLPKANHFPRYSGPNTPEAHSGRRGSHAVLQEQAVLQGITRTIRLHLYGFYICTPHTI